MTKAMPFLQKAILLSYDPRRFGPGRFACKNQAVWAAFCSASMADSSGITVRRMVR